MPLVKSNGAILPHYGLILPMLPKCCFGASLVLDMLESHHTRMELGVDLSLNLNVLAIFAVFVFVAALLLGAF